ncbi:MAG: Rib/alpha-like domain-containing protein [Lactobacillus sp.]|nr:Rib/alpha-like domain-containing protein [Lactobacillus sp.]
MFKDGRMQPKFKLRKLTIGLCSIATLFIFATNLQHSQVVYADDTTTVAQSDTLADKAPDSVSIKVPKAGSGYFTDQTIENLVSQQLTGYKSATLSNNSITVTFTDDSTKTIALTKVPYYQAVLYLSDGTIRPIYQLKDQVRILTAQDKPTVFYAYDKYKKLASVSFEEDKYVTLDTQEVWQELQDYADELVKSHNHVSDELKAQVEQKIKDLGLDPTNFYVEPKFSNSNKFDSLQVWDRYFGIEGQNYFTYARGPRHLAKGQINIDMLSTINDDVYIYTGDNVNDAIYDNEKRNKLLEGDNIIVTPQNVDLDTSKSGDYTVTAGYDIQQSPLTKGVTKTVKVHILPAVKPEFKYEDGHVPDPATVFEGDIPEGGTATWEKEPTPEDPDAKVKIDFDSGHSFEYDTKGYAYTKGEPLTNYEADWYRNMDDSELPYHINNSFRFPAGKLPDASDEVTGELPDGAKASWKKQPTPEDPNGTVTVTFSDGSTIDYPIVGHAYKGGDPLTGTEADLYKELDNTPYQVPSTFKYEYGKLPEPSEVITGELPDGAKASWKKQPTPEDPNGELTVTFKDGSSIDYPIVGHAYKGGDPLTGTEADLYRDIEDTPYQINKETSVEEVPDARTLVTGNLPEGAKVTWKKLPSKDDPNGEIEIQFNDGSVLDYPVKVYLKDKETPAEPTKADEQTEDVTTNDGKTTTPVKVSKKQSSTPKTTKPVAKKLPQTGENRIWLLIGSIVSLLGLAGFKKND